MGTWTNDATVGVAMSAVRVLILHINPVISKMKMKIEIEMKRKMEGEEGGMWYKRESLSLFFNFKIPNYNY